MNHSRESTVWHFFDSHDLSDQQAEALWKGESLSRVAQELQGKVPVPFWSSARRQIDQALQDVLSVPVSDILAGGWNKYRALIEYRDRKKHPAEEVALVALHEHTISSTHKAQIEIFLNERRIGSLDFDIELALEIEAAILKIQDGKIWEVEAGACQGRGTVSFGPAVLFERKTSSVHLPKIVSFTNGVPI